MKLMDKINMVLHPIMRRYVCCQYHKQLNSIAKKHPDYFQTCERDQMKRHQDLWSKLLPKVDGRALNVLTSLTGICDYRYVPEDVFYTVIERCLNDCNTAGSSVENKVDVDFYIPEKYRVHTIVRYVRGTFFDSKMEPISASTADRFLAAYSGDVVVKPAMDSCGGSGVRLFKLLGGEKMSDGERLSADWLVAHGGSFVVQERLKQEKVMSSFNPTSLNTCRIVTFRRPWSGEVSAIAGMVRIGAIGSVVDNVTSGGVCVAIRNDGRLVDFGLNHEFDKYTEIRALNKKFAGASVPGFFDMCMAACEVARHVPGFNLLGFDVVIREDGRPSIIEINGTSQAMLKLQTAGPLFGNDTEKLVAWCSENSRFDTFNHLRTWY